MTRPARILAMVAALGAILFVLRADPVGAQDTPPAPTASPHASADGPAQACSNSRLATDIRVCASSSPFGS